MKVFLPPAARWPIKAWVDGVPFDENTLEQVTRTAALKFVFKHVPVMPDAHAGLGSTVGTVIPTRGAIVPAAVGVDIGCGMLAAKTSLRAENLPDSLAGIREAIERAVPHGRTDHGGPNDRGAWGEPPANVVEAWDTLADDFDELLRSTPKIEHAGKVRQLGTLGTGNHFLEVCLDEAGSVWLMLHSGSRGVGNRIGERFIELAQKDMDLWHIELPDKDLAFLPEGSEHFRAYVKAVGWAQHYARMNRQLMLSAAVNAMLECGELPWFELEETVIDCHHNYVAREHHFGENVWVTRKGAVRAREGDLGIIPGSMGARSFIVRGKGNPDSFMSCSHGAGRTMSRAEARRRFTVEDHVRLTAGVECRKDAAVIDEIPAAYKDIDAVMAAQVDLVDVVHTLKQVVCVKG